MQQDSDPKHLKWKALYWPTQSPDFDPHDVFHAEEETDGKNHPKQTTTEGDYNKSLVKHIKKP